MATRKSPIQRARGKRQLPTEADLEHMSLREINLHLTPQERGIAVRMAIDPEADLLQAYIDNSNATPPTTTKQAASCREAARNIIKRPHVKRYIKLRAAMEADAAGVSEAYVVSGLATIADRCMQAEAVLDNEGTPTGEFRFDAGNGIRALTQIGHWLEMWQERKKVDVNVTLEQFIGEISGTTASSPMARLQSKHAEALAIDAQIVDDNGDT